ncbi:60S ribosome subunit biogenesis protein NIP7 homolog [Condylostylus longicornis]|uniref:60S ribosome subunit biogenesis protein NIP7 homolog n=1 Tax=Condylostylus longicornis TaxID=2530218 RepID=UPI00244E5263|nr:60S ribosome subunit biogenesis protein NIP7 homolog [Condylostylus longicornis]
MKRLNEERTKILFEKLNKYIGSNVKQLIDRPDGTYCFREHRDRVYYMSEKILKFSECLGRDKLISVGTCFGKFSKSNKFKLHITALYYLAPYAQHKIWVKPSFEQQFLYGNHIPKSGLGRITENTQQYQGVIVYSMSDLPLGFGVAARSTMDCKTVEPLSTVCFHQADIGEYIRSEDILF